MNKSDSDFKTLQDALATRRYFAKFERIIANLADVAKHNLDERRISDSEFELLGVYLTGLANTFTALSYKFLMASRVIDGQKLLSIDKKNSGYPVFSEILHMLSDMAQASDHLASLKTKRKSSGRSSITS